MRKKIILNLFVIIIAIIPFFSFSQVTGTGFAIHPNGYIATNYHVIEGQDKIIVEERTLPNIEVKTLKGDAFNISQLDNDGKPMVISFWATWCKPCKKELNNISEVYEDWQDETGVKLVAISIDDSRSMSKVAPYINASDWEYEVYLDPNKDLCRLLGVSTVPHTFLLNGEKKIVWQHRGYIEGDEQELYDKIVELAK